MIMEKLNNNDYSLIQQAKKAIEKNFDNEGNNISIGAALRCKNGKVYVGVNMHFNHGACAEVIAIGSAITDGEREFDCIVAIHGNGEILNPCGNCRQMLSDYAADCDVVINTEKGKCKIKAYDLIPYAYTRKSLLGRKMLKLLVREVKKYIDKDNH